MIWFVGIFVVLIFALMIVPGIRTRAYWKTALQVTYASFVLGASVYISGRSEEGSLEVVGLLIFSFMAFNAAGNLWCKVCGTLRPGGVRVCEKCGASFPQAWPWT